jgi:hypothetical protein
MLSDSCNSKWVHGRSAASVQQSGAERTGCLDCCGDPFTEAGLFSRFKITTTSHSQQDNGLYVARYVTQGRYGSLGRTVACVALEKASDGHGRHVRRINMYR